MKALKRNLDDLITTDISTMIKPTKAQILKADKEFQKAVTERDNHTCILSENRYDCLLSPVCAHHIIPRRHLKSRHKIINGVSLCVKCHQNVHNRPRLYEGLIITIQVENGIIESAEYWDEFKREAIK